MNCPKCGYSYSKIVDVRKSGKATKRRRVCVNCGQRYTGYELSADDYRWLITEIEIPNKKLRQIKNIMEGRLDE